MAPSVLGVGIPSTTPGLPEEARGPLQKALDFMESDMEASPYDFEVFYILPDAPLDGLIEKMRTKKWDIVMVGVGLRTGKDTVPFFEKIVNAVHEELPQAKFAFNTGIRETQQACRRIIPV